MAATTKIIAIAAVAIVVIAGASVGIYELMKNSKGSDEPGPGPTPEYTAQSAAEAFINDYTGKFKGDDDTPMTAVDGVVTAYVKSNEKTLKFCITFKKTTDADNDFATAVEGASEKIWSSAKATKENRNTVYGGFDNFYGIFSNWIMGSTPKGYMYFVATQGDFIVETIGGVASSGEPNSANYIALNSSFSSHADRFAVITSVAKALKTTAVDTDIYLANSFAKKYEGVFSGDENVPMTVEGNVVTAHVSSGTSTMTYCIKFSNTDDGAVTLATAQSSATRWTSSGALAKEVEMTISGFDGSFGYYSNWEMGSKPKGYMTFGGYYGDIFVQTIGGKDSKSNDANYIANNVGHASSADRSKVLSTIGEIIGIKVDYSDALTAKIQSFATDYGDKAFGPYTVLGHDAVKFKGDKSYTLEFNNEVGDAAAILELFNAAKAQVDELPKGTALYDCTSFDGFDGIYLKSVNRDMGGKKTTSVYFTAYIGNVYINSVDSRQYNVDDNNFATADDVQALLTAIATAFA